MTDCGLRIADCGLLCMRPARRLVNRLASVASLAMALIMLAVPAPRAGAAGMMHRDHATTGAMTNGEQGAPVRKMMRRAHGTTATMASQANAVTTGGAASAAASPTPRRHKRSANAAQPQGESARAIASAGPDSEDVSGLDRWEMRLPFWPRKAVLLIDLALTIALGVLIGQILEVSGFSRWLAVLAWPLIRLGRLPKAAGPAFVVAFRSGSMAYSMLVSLRDQRLLSRRHLYTSVLVVSCIALLAHLPSFAMPLGIAFGWQATAALFGVRLSAILLEIIVVLLVSRALAGWWLKERAEEAVVADEAKSGEHAHAPARRGGFWAAVWSRSQRSLGRMMIYLVPTFVVMSLLEYYKFFEWLAARAPGLFSFSFLPPQALAIIPAQAVGLYNGAIAAANFVDAGKITIHQAILVILFGSMITAPVRTLKRALPTYLTTLGARAGSVLAVTAQVLRVLFLLLCTYVLMMIWR